MDLFQWISHFVLLQALRVFAENHELQHVISDLKSQDFDQFIASSDVRVVYFYKKDLPEIRKFFREYDNSAFLMKNYNVQFAKIDCTKDSLTRYCDKEEVEQNVYSFRDGQEMIPLTLSTMFDVNSIVSNVLQLVLLREVPILQSLEERKQTVENYGGFSNVIYSYQAALGTYDHRILMEVAYAYHEKYKFAITTERETVKDLLMGEPASDTALWLFRCKSPLKDENQCRKYRYRGNMDLTSLAAFFKVIDKQLIQESDGEAIDDVFVGEAVSVVYMLYDTSSENAVKQAAQKLVDEYYGLVGVVLVNVAKFGINFPVPDSKIPVVGIRLLNKGEKEFMKTPFSEESTLSFVEGKLKEIIKSLPSAQSGADVGEITDDDLNAAETQDDPVAAAVFRLRNQEMNMSHVPALTDKTFYPTTQSASVLMVLYYLTFDARSMAFLRYYVDASHKLAEQSFFPLARIDCFDWTDVCGKENITSYPTIRVFRKGKETAPYKGMLDKASIVKTVKLYEASSPMLISEIKEVIDFTEGHHPVDMSHYTTVSVLGIFMTSDDKELKEFRRAAGKMQGQLIFGAYVGDLANQIGHEYKVEAPAVVVIKRSDVYQPVVTFTKKSEMTEKKILDFVMMNKLELFPQLTALNFPAYFARKVPLALLFDQNVAQGTGLNLQVGNIARSGQFSDIVFAWLDAKTQSKLITHVLSAYDPSATPPAFAVVNHKTGTIHMYSGKMTTASMSDWLDQVKQMKIQPTSILQKGEWKPLHPGYDFLKLMKQDQKKPHPIYNAEEDDVYTDEGFEKNDGMIEKNEEEDMVRTDLKSLRQSKSQMSSTPPLPAEHTEL